MIFGFKDNKCKGKVYTQDEVDNLLASHTHAEYKVKGDFATIETTVTMIDSDPDGTTENYAVGHTLVDYPEGFTKDNTRVIGIEHKDGYVYKDGWATNFVYETTEYPLGITVFLNEQIAVQLHGANTNILTQTVRVTLMKI